MAERGERRTGFAKVPLRCPACTRRFPSSVVVLHGTVLRCDGCQAHVYALPVLHAGVVFVARIERHEAVLLAQRGATASEVLEHLGVLLTGAA